MPPDASEPDEPLDLRHRLRVKRCGRLVEQEDARLVRQRPRDRDPRPLPAGQLLRFALEQRAVQAHGRQRGGSVRFRLRVEEVRAARRRAASPATVPRERRDGAARTGRASRCRRPRRAPRPPRTRIQSDDAAQQARLARAGVAHERGDAAGLDPEIDSVEDDPPSALGPQAANLEDRRVRHGAQSSRRPPSAARVPRPPSPAAVSGSPARTGGSAESRSTSPRQASGS